LDNRATFTKGMRESLHLGRVAGVRVGMGWSLLPAFAFIAWSLAVGQLPYEVPGYSASAYWVVGVLTAVAFFAGLLAHELSHAVVARRRGLQVQGIVLWLFGGVAQMEGEMPDARTELLVAIVGPATSLLIAGLGSLAAWGLDAVGASAIVVAAVAWLAVINGMLGVFNLLPAFPLDGGRLLRAGLWWRWKDQTRATRAAAGSGRFIGMALIALGVIQWLRLGSMGGLWLAAIGWFVLAAANQARRPPDPAAPAPGPGPAPNLAWSTPDPSIPAPRLLEGLRASDAMTAEPVVVPSTETVAEAMSLLAAGPGFSSLPVGDEASGRIVGLTTVARLSRLPAERRSSTTVAEVAAGPAELVVCAPWEPLPDVSRRMAATTDQRCLVISGGRLVGIISPSDIARVAARARV